jgi:Rad21/Rec8 like protein
MTSTIASFPPLERKRKFSSTDKEEQEVEEERRKTMFYSQCLLSSKGPLGAIWVAGYFFKRLKKRQITDTDICSSVGLSPFRFFFLILVEPSIFI